jgi:NADH-quinone oxidoreductase subunit C
MDPNKVKQELEALATKGVPQEESSPEVEAAEPTEGDAKTAKKVDDAPRSNGLIETDYASRGFHLDVQLDPDQVVQAAEILDSAGLTMETVTGVDWLKDGQFEVVYDYTYTGGELFRVVIRARVDRETPDIPTISEIFPGANWHERETWDLFGINFVGHPQLERFLLPDDCDFHPLRKDFTT